MRLASVQGRAVEDILKDPKNAIPESALQREYRSTYRDKLIGTEKLILGKWQPRAALSSGPILVSLEEGIAQRLKVRLGDELVFDVQGLPVATRVGSLRKVEWERVQPNFFVVFPAGVLEDAPQFYVMVLKTGSNEESARLQQTVVQRFPNVSAIDLALIVNMIDTILEQGGFRCPLYGVVQYFYRTRRAGWGRGYRQISKNSGERLASNSGRQEATGSSNHAR